MHRLAEYGSPSDCAAKENTTSQLNAQARRGDVRQILYRLIGAGNMYIYIYMYMYKYPEGEADTRCSVRAHTKGTATTPRREREREEQKRTGGNIGVCGSFSLRDPPTWLATMNESSWQLSWRAGRSDVKR